jgi:hypothetical protein
LVTDQPEAARRDITQVQVQCRNGVATVQALDPVTGKSLSRRIDLTDEPSDVWPRLLGLAIAELVTASWVELAANPKPQVRPSGATASEAVRRAARQSVTRLIPRLMPPSELTPVAREPTPAPLTWLELSLGGSWRGQDKSPQNLLGTTIRVDRWPWKPLAFDARIEYWSSQLPAQYKLPGSSVNTLLLSIGGFFLMRGELGPLHVSAGPGLRGGLARLEGVTANARAVEALPAVWGGWGGPALMANAAFFFTPSWFALVAAEAGWSPARVTAFVNDSTGAEVGGFWGAASLLAGVRL